LKYLPVVSALLLFAASTTAAFAQSTGESVQVVKGVVNKVETVEMTSEDKSADGAVVGGAIGYSHSQDSGDAIVGAAVGAVAGSSKTTPGLRYTVTTADGSNVAVVVGDTRAIDVGSCVSAEVSADRSTIRAVDQAVCDLEMQTAVPRSQPQAQAAQESGNCQAAQQQLLDAKTAEEVEIANSKIQILCD
jgi:hypothetical protein